MKRIKITSGITYGHRNGIFIVPKTKLDEPFEVSDDEAFRLIGAGYAKLIDDNGGNSAVSPDSAPITGENEESKGVNSSDEENLATAPENAENDIDGDTVEYLSEFTVPVLKCIAKDCGIAVSELSKKAEFVEAIAGTGIEVPFTEEVLGKFSCSTLKEIAKEFDVYTSELRSKEALIGAICADDEDVSGESSEGGDIIA